MNKPLHCQLAKPVKSLADFVDTFSSLQNLSDTGEAVVIPNGKIDLQFSKTTDNELQVSLLGIETQPNKKSFPKQENLPLFAVSFNPLAAEYIFKHSIADILNDKKELPNNFWDFNISDLNDFDLFVKNISQKIQSLLPKEIDERKHKLFELIFATNGEMSVKELSENVFYSTRQINAYFNQQFGLSLKTYCNIIRFQASLSHIKDGKISPQLNYYDQSHFIKEIKKLSGASPKELLKNENSRFLQFLVPTVK